MTVPVDRRVRNWRISLRVVGLRPVQSLVPDVSRPGFVKECRRQSRIVALSDAADLDLTALLDTALLDADEAT